MLRDDLNNSSVNSNPNWLAKKQIMSELKKQIMAAKENAFNDIYERMNSCGSMGISFCGQGDRVDFHGLSVEAAKRFIQDPILTVLPVLKKIMIITGRGLHSQTGQGVLKSAITSYLDELKVKFEDVVGNDGALYVIAK
jgi:hypothetical protein